MTDAEFLESLPGEMIERIREVAIVPEGWRLTVQSYGGGQLSIVIGFLDNRTPREDGKRKTTSFAVDRFQRFKSREDFVQTVAKRIALAIPEAVWMGLYESTEITISEERGYDPP